MNALRSVQGFRQCGAVPGIQHGLSRIQQEGDIHLLLPDSPDEILQRSVGRRGRSLQQLDARSDRAETVSYTHLDVYKRQAPAIW